MPIRFSVQGVDAALCADPPAVTRRDAIGPAGASLGAAPELRHCPRLALFAAGARRSGNRHPRSTTAPDHPRAGAEPRPRAPVFAGQSGLGRGAPRDRHHGTLAVHPLGRPHNRLQSGGRPDGSWLRRGGGRSVAAPHAGLRERGRRGLPCLEPVVDVLRRVRAGHAAEHPAPHPAGRSDQPLGSVTPQPTRAWTWVSSM